MSKPGGDSGADARQVYRVSFDPEDAPTVAVKSDRSALAGRVADLSSQGLGAVFSEAPVPVLSLGSRAELCVTGSAFRKPITMKARVRFRLQKGPAWRYGFSFDDEEELEAQLGSEMFRIFNRRSSFRVHPDPKAPIEVEIAVPGDESSRVTGTLEDVSATGIGVQLELGREHPGFVQGEIEVHFSLPPSGSPLRLVARLRRAALEDEKLAYGLEFDAEASESFDRQQESVMDYIMQRQRELLQVKVER